MASVFIQLASVFIILASGFKKLGAAGCKRNIIHFIVFLKEKKNVTSALELG